MQKYSLLILVSILFLGNNKANAAEFNIEVKTKLFANGRKVKGCNIMIFNNRGQLYKEFKDAKHALAFTLPLDDDFIIFITSNTLETKVINFCTKIEGMSIGDFWGKHKFKTELLSNNENITQKTLHAIERIDWSSNSMSFQHVNVALLHKYRSDFEYLIKKEKYAECTNLIYKNINEFLSGEKSLEEEITPDIIKQKASQNKETLEQLLLKRELIKAELESTLLKVELLEDPTLKKTIEQNVASVSKMIRALDVDIEKAKIDYSQTLKILSKYEDIDQKLYQLRTQFNVQAELNPEKIDDEQSFIDSEHLPRNESISNALNSAEKQLQDSEEKLEDIQNENTKAQIKEESKENSINTNENKKSPPQAAKTEPVTQKDEKSSPSKDDKTDNNALEAQAFNAEGNQKDIIRDLLDNHTPIKTYTIEILEEPITVRKYKTNEGVFEVLTDKTNQIQMLKNNVLVTEDIITQKELDYYKKLEKLNQIEIRYDQLDKIKKTPINGLIYRIQVAAVSKKAPHSFSNLIQFGPLAEDYVGGFYKYMIGSYETIDQLANVKKEVRQIIPGAFSVVYYFGTRISMKHAYNIISQAL